MSSAENKRKLKEIEDQILEVLSKSQVRKGQVEEAGVKPKSQVCELMLVKTCQLKSPCLKSKSQVCGLMFVKTCQFEVASFEVKEPGEGRTGR